MTKQEKTDTLKILKAFELHKMKQNLGQKIMMKGQTNGEKKAFINGISTTIKELEAYFRKLEDVK